MIAQWMLHVAFVTALLGLAATASERVLRLWRRQARMVWVAVMVLSSVLGPLGYPSRVPRSSVAPRTNVCANASPVVRTKSLTEPGITPRRTPR